MRRIYMEKEQWETEIDLKVQSNLFRGNMIYEFNRSCKIILTGLS